MAPRRDKRDELASDAELLARAGRNPGAFATFYERHARAVYGFFWNRTVCAETAADLTAETFAQAYLSRRRYRAGPALASAWLFSIARHQLAHFIRSSQVNLRARKRLGMTLDGHVDEGLERVEQLADLSPTATAVRDALGSMSSTLADAVRLRVVDELTFAEVAEKLGCTPATARQRVARGLAQMATRLEATQ